jgi:hypothetical protein
LRRSATESLPISSTATLACVNCNVLLKALEEAHQNLSIEVGLAEGRDP